MLTTTLTYYNSNAPAFVQNTVDVPFTDIQDAFLECIPAGGRILDFGCGSGRDTKYFLNKGYIVDAIDGSEELCKIASEYTGIQAKCMLFDELETLQEYDGIWACASILHVEKVKLPEILKKMAVATKTGGTIYVSFKYGDFEGMRNGRFFTDLKESTFEELIKDIPGLVIKESWITTDVRVERGEEIWLNMLLGVQA